MKKSAKLVGGAIMAMGMLFSSVTTGDVSAAANTSNAQEKVRVYVESTNQSEKIKVKGQHDVRWEFDGKGFSTEMTEKQFNALQKNKNLKVRELEEFEIAAEIQNTALASAPADQTPWGIQAIYNNPNIAVTSGGQNIRIAVLDTGIMRNHLDLVNNVEQCKDFTQTTSAIVNNSCTDRNGHGTHVAGSALADGGSDGQGIYGVAPDAKLWGYKVLGDNGSGFSDDIAGAIRHAADQASAQGVKVVINMSLGSAGKDPLITSAVEYAYSRGALVVAAAGNSGSAANTIGYPGALPQAVAVAALENVQQNGTYRVANFSSRGNPNTDGDYIIGERDVEISAPGAGITSTWIDGNYNTISGTSMATPHVAGLAAKIWATNPAQSNVQVRTTLQNRAKQNDILSGTGAAVGDDYASGFGFARVQ